MTGQKGRLQTALVLGATSDIGRAIARKLAPKVRLLQLAGRDLDALEREAWDLCVRADVALTVHHCDVLDEDGGRGVVETADPLPDVVVCAVGALGDQREAERNQGLADEVMRTNYVGPALLLGAFAERFAARGSGVLVGISSVAGDRGRRSNYVYGSAKASFTAFLSGLRHRLAVAGVHVVTVKPGFVRTRMTAGMELPPLLTAEPTEVADAVVSAIRSRRNVVYVRRLWRAIMWGIRLMPEPVFKRLSI